jgi:hypothetical protein
MDYTDENGRFIKLGNPRYRRLNGGLIPENEKSYHPDKIPFRRELIDRDADTVKSLIEVGSVVIPRSVVPLLPDEVKSNPGKGSATGHRMPVIVQPKEFIVGPSQSRRVLSFLRRNHGITLPLKSSFF